MSRTIAGLGVRLLPAAPYRVNYVAASYVAGFSYDPQTGVHAIGTDRKSAFQARAGGLAWLARGCDVFSASERGGEYLQVTTQERLIEADNFRDIPDPAADQIARRLRLALITGRDEAACEPLVLALLERVRCRAAGPSAPPTAWLTPQRLRAVDEFIDLRLPQTILVSDLAHELGLSPGFFSRAFRLGLGWSPQRYIRERRVQTARRLVMTTRWPLAEIAFQCGYVSHAHMTTEFRRILGGTPSQLRS